VGSLQTANHPRDQNTRKRQLFYFMFHCLQQQDKQIVHGHRLVTFLLTRTSIAKPAMGSQDYTVHHRPVTFLLLPSLFSFAMADRH
jgi:hypothetical protein